MSVHKKKRETPLVPKNCFKVQRLNFTIFFLQILLLCISRKDVTENIHKQINDLNSYKHLFYLMLDVVLY